MKYFRVGLAAWLMAVVVGCGKEDLNKNLKPVDPNAPRPQVGSEKGEGDKPARP